MTPTAPYEDDPDRDKMLAYTDALENVPTPVLSTREEQRDFIFYQKQVVNAIMAIRKHAAQPRND